jgi:hypothetical protein
VRIAFPGQASGRGIRPFLRDVDTSADFDTGAAAATEAGAGQAIIAMHCRD